MSRAPHPYTIAAATAPQLTLEDERALAFRVSGGDTSAVDTLVRANLGLVIEVARKFSGRGLDFDDLVGEGSVALMNAAMAYDGRSRFALYAMPCISAAMRGAVSRSIQLVGLTSHALRLLRKWDRMAKKLAMELGRPASNDEIDEALGLSESESRTLSMALLARRAKVDSVISGDTGSASEVETFASYDAEPHDEAPDPTVYTAVRARWKTLTEQERVVVGMTCGLGGGLGMSLREIAARGELNHETIRKIYRRGLGKLRAGFVGV